MDEGLKKQAEQLFDEFGMNMTTAFTVFAKTVVREKRIPFEIGISNHDTLLAMKETDEILSDPSKAKGYTDVHQMFQEILDEK
jgi:DNA-damage-inducible protein J